MAEIINNEVYLLLGLGIIAHYESQANLKHISVGELLFCGKAPEEWLSDYEWNVWYYFGEERIFFAISFLLHGLYPELPRKGEKAIDEIEDLNNRVEQFKEAFLNHKDRSALASERSYRMRADLITVNLDAVLRETGKLEMIERHQIVRYLHDEVLRPKDRHNPVFTNLSAFITASDSFLSRHKLKEHPKSFGFSMPNHLISKLDDALNGTATLPVIAAAARQLFFFTASVAEQQEKRYTSPKNFESSFAHDIDMMIRKMHDIRQRKLISTEDLEQIKKLSSMLMNDFYGSYLKEALQLYVVDLDTVVRKSLEEANKRLKRMGFRNVYKPEINRLTSDRKNEYLVVREFEGDIRVPKSKADLLVLCEYHLLHEFLRNLFSNLSHSFPRKKKRALIPQDAVKIHYELGDVMLRPDNRIVPAVKLVYSVSGGDPPKKEELSDPEQTIGDQLSKLHEFGGVWRLRPEGKGFTFELTLISRKGFRR